VNEDALGCAKTRKEKDKVKTAEMKPEEDIAGPSQTEY
jgi:hypothetical protein